MDNILLNEQQNPTGSLFSFTRDGAFPDSLSVSNRLSCPIRGTQEKIEALERAVFNLKLERFLLQEELKKATGRTYKTDNQNLLQSLKEHQLKYDRILRELEDKSEALTDALTTIEYQKKIEAMLKESHAAEIHKYQHAVLVLENKLKQKDDNLRLFRLRKQKLIRKLKERSLNGIGGECAEVIALPGRVLTSRFSAYRKKLFRVKLISVASSCSPSSSDTASLNEEFENGTKSEDQKANADQQQQQQDEIISNKLLIMILKWIVMRHSIKHEREFHLDVIFTRDALENMASIEVVGTEATETATTTVAATATAASSSSSPPDQEVANNHSKQTETIANSNIRNNNKISCKSFDPNPTKHETSDLKLSPVHLIKLILMPFGCPFRQ